MDEYLGLTRLEWYRLYIVTGLVGASIYAIILSIKKGRQIGKTWNDPMGKVVEIHDKELRCHFCNHNKFQKRDGLLTTTWILFFWSAFFNKCTSCYVCTHCSHIHRFIKKP